MKTDDTRLCRATNGLEFEDFFVDAWPLAFQLACHFTQDRSAGEEIAQEVLTEMYRKWGAAENPYAYLRTSIVNRAKSWHRHRGTKREKLPLAVTPDHVDLVADELADVLAALPFRQRAVIVMRYYFDLSEADIADALGCRPGTVKSLASRALKRLEKEIPR